MSYTRLRTDTFFPTHIMELVRGQRVDPEVVNTIGNMINSSGVRCAAFTTLEASLLHTSEVWPLWHHPDLDEYDALLFHIYTLAEEGLLHTLVVANIITATVYYIMSKDRAEWRHNSNDAEWIQHLELQQTALRFNPRRRWELVRWPTPQQGAE